MPEHHPFPLFSENPMDSVFACPPGLNFADAIADGLRERMRDHPRELMGRVVIYANAARMRDKILQRFQSGTAGFVPKIRLITDIPSDFGAQPDISPKNTLQRRLELRQMVSRLVEQEPGLAPLSAVPDLSDSLFSLIEEMADEGVTHSDIAALDVTDESGHWERAQRFLSIVTNFVGPGSRENIGAAEWFRNGAIALVDQWKSEPPKYPVLIVGSTGSRGTTAMLMRAAAQTENCALVLPGFDQHMPANVWNRLALDEPTEDHPQFRFAQFLADLNMQAGEVLEWANGTTQAQRNRNAVISLSLRPAPVTNHWITESQKLVGLPSAMSGVSILEAPDARKEALAIAIAMREGLEIGKSTALITPDPELTRMVTVALRRWNIVPDSSMGQPFGQSPPGRLMRQIMRLGSETPETEAVLALLKHPLVHSGAERGEHLTHTRLLELWLRKNRVPFVEPHLVEAWLKTLDESAFSRCWSDWLKASVLSGALSGRANLVSLCKRHFELAEDLCAGSVKGAPSAELWNERAGQVLAEFHSEITQAAPHGGKMVLAEYLALFENLMKGREVRATINSHPQVMIWGTLEARVQTVDRVILGGLNEGIWPETNSADPWLNRSLRREAGLLVPDRKIGLSAHDYQIAVAAPEVILSRSFRTADAETVPSRWINRLCNLLSGMSGEGKEIWDEMRGRGSVWVELANRVETPASTDQPELRPAPIVPPFARSRRLSVTDVTRVAQDPYALYARQVLRLEPVPPLHAAPDARTKGIAIHEIADRGLKAFNPHGAFEEEKARFLKQVEDVLSETTPWPETRALWESQIRAILSDLLTQEAERRLLGDIALTESKATLMLQDGKTQLVCKADRIDRTPEGEAILYDYKTGQLPPRSSVGVQEMQLLLEALIVEQGGFEELGPTKVRALAYLAIKRGLESTEVDLTPDQMSKVADELEQFTRAYFDTDYGHVSRRYPNSYDGDFDHLARHGEWADGDPIYKVDLT